MPITYYDIHPRRDTRFATATMIANATFATVVLASWSHVAGILSGPLSWATGESISPSPPLLEYPFVLLWLLPIASMAMGWVATRVQLVRVAHFVGIYPLLLLALMVSWYHLAPPHWR